MSSPTFTARQLEVVEGLAWGDSKEELAERLGLAERTVRVHADNVRRKLGVDVARRIPGAFLEQTGRDPFTAAGGEPS